MAGSERTPIAQVVADLVGAAGELLRAEVSALLGEFKVDAQGAGRALVWALAAFALIFWAVALLAAAAVLALSLWLQPWLAATAAGGGVLLLGVVAVLMARSRLRALRSPQAVFDARWQAHRSWWDREMASAMPGSVAQGTPTEKPGSPAEDDIPAEKEL